MERITRKRLRVVGMEVKGTFAELATRVPQTWSALFLRAHELPQRVHADYVELSLGEREGVYTEVLGVLVDAKAAEPAPPGMVAVDLPAATWLRAEHEGPLAGIAQSYAKLLSWAAEEGLAVDGVMLDQGYTRGEEEESHQLHVRLAEAG